MIRTVLGCFNLRGKKCLDFSQNGSVMLSGEIPFLFQDPIISLALESILKSNEQSKGSIPNSLAEPGRMLGALGIEKPCDVSSTKKDNNKI